MANLPETSNFDNGVYQWETTDPVTGGANGIANSPLKNLVNRTRWLFDQVEAILVSIGALAPINSPQLTGTPKSTTPDASVSGTEIITAAWARNMRAGVANITISGDTSLTATAAGAGIISVTGTTAADSFLLFPPGTGTWIINNGTNHRLKCRLNSGGAVATVAAGLNKLVWSNGTNFFLSLTDFESVALSGIPVTPTPLPDDNSVQIANTAWARGIANTTGWRAAMFTTTTTWTCPPNVFIGGW